jgi:hypothetical protein
MTVEAGQHRQWRRGAQKFTVTAVEEESSVEAGVDIFAIIRHENDGVVRVAPVDRIRSSSLLLPEEG